MKTNDIFFKNKSFYLIIGSISAIGSFAYFGQSLHSFLSKYGLLIKSKHLNNEKQYIYLSDSFNDYTSDELSEDGMTPITANTKPMSSRTHWQLLRLSQYKRDHIIREFAIQSIAKIQLNEHECREIAQSCDFETSVRLARIPNVNLKLFLPPIKTNLINLSPNTSLQSKIPSKYFNFDEILLHILRESYISGKECSECTKYFTQLAIRILETERHSKEIGQSLDYDHIHQHKRFSAPKVNWICLQAITENVLCGENQCKRLINNGLFIILHYLREKFPDLKVQSWVAQTLANLSIYKESHLHFYYTGFLGVLAQWLQSNQLELSLSAAKILYNMSEKSENNLLPESLYLFHPIFHDSQNKNFDIVFVHGLLGGVFKTWRQSDSQRKLETYTRCWPQEWLANDINNIRILAVNYQTYLSNWNIQCPHNDYSFKAKSSQLLNELKTCKVGQKPIIWVTHSMGGLLVKQILSDINESTDLKVKSILENTKGIVFYSVPHKGTDMAVWSQPMQRIISPSSQVLELSKDSQFLQLLHNQFVKLVENNRIECLSFGETLKSTLVSKPFKWKYLLVPEDSADPGIGRFHLLPVDHLNSCKPISKSSEAYSITFDFIKYIIESHVDKYEDKSDKIDILLNSVFS